MKTITIIITFFLSLFINEVSAQYNQFNVKASYRGGLIENPFSNQAAVDKSLMLNVGLEKRLYKHIGVVLSIDYLQFADREPDGTAGGFLDIANPDIRTRTVYEKYIEGTLKSISLGPSLHYQWDFFELSLAIQGGATHIGLDMFLDTNYQIIDGESIFSRDAYQYERKIFPSVAITPELSLSISKRWAFLVSANYTRIFSDKKIKEFIAVEEADISGYPLFLGQSIETKRRDIPDLNRVFGVLSLGVGIRFTIL